jgi:predicted secreted Zn-dependent protease
LGAKISVSTLEALTRELSDHTSLLFNTGDAAHKGNTYQFKFKLGWLTRDGFHDMVAKVWQRASRGNSPMQQWQNKIRAIRRWLRGWAKNLVGENKKKEILLASPIICSR